MPTTIVTGRDITFTIDSDNFDAQATSAILTLESTIQTYQTLDGKAYYTTDTQGTFDVEMLADWTAGGSLCNALWDAAAAAPQTPLAVVFTAASGSVFSFTVQPIFPTAGGAAPDAQTVSLSFTCVTTPSLA
ncbi:hypothetical protein UFOVP799_2 [uncultured Caudovirales phage]|jgi:hypothetical protein|uniref:Uncharacterized protein n=1 Tax=uncultured Caudovirales phage TaxID=2100421 RepID=A0A6J5P136_9CAUD|nr:hypothetical protein UFOVP799_2 [uncultured Caudovirales phage]